MVELQVRRVFQIATNKLLDVFVLLLVIFLYFFFPLGSVQNWAEKGESPNSEAAATLCIRRASVSN